MNKESFDFLIKDEVQKLIEANLDTDPGEFALKQNHNELPPALVPTQIKNLRKSKKKIPTFYHARCIIPTRAYEQCSSEKTAKTRPFTGHLEVETYTWQILPEGLKQELDQSIIRELEWVLNELPP